MLLLGLSEMNPYTLISLLNIVAFLWITFCLFRVVLGTNLIKGDISSNDIALITLWVFYAVPLVILAAYDQGPELFPPMLTIATQNTQTAWIHAPFLMFVASLLILSRKPSAYKNFNSTFGVGFKADVIFLYPLSFMLLVLCIYLVISSPEPSSYLEYGLYSRAQTRHLVSYDMAAWHAWITTLATLCILCSGVLLMVQAHRKNIPALLFTYIPVVSLAAWFNGKRNAVAMGLFFILLVVGLKKNLSTGLKVLLVIFLLVAFTCYSSWYQARRGLDGVNTVESYLLNFGRDHCLRLAIFTELNGDEILEYRGQSFVFDLLAFIPRSFWPEKPWPYATYFTSKAFGNRDLHVYGWQVTTGIFDECISNFSWAGLVIGPLIVLCLCRINDKDPRLFVRVCGYLIITLLQVVHLPAFYSIFYLWLILIIWQKLFPIQTYSNKLSG